MPRHSPFDATGPVRAALSALCPPHTLVEVPSADLAGPLGELPVKLSTMAAGRYATTLAV
ncbi:hypothetical protein ABT369_18355 [Dactylosporangium sp. NPDC000244]|uniref:hypothetical protein n=1 Tax=Dactylosporangium sp. NPDC000244 TaxID=3154365 RepID=UPI00332968E4